MRIKGGAKWGEFSAAARIDVTITAPPLAATKKVGVIPDWTLATSGPFTVNDPTDDAITDQKRSGSIQDPNGAHFLVNSVEQAPGATIEVPASQLGEVSGTVLDAVPALSLGGGDGKANDAAASTNGSAGDTVGGAFDLEPIMIDADSTVNFTAATPVGTGSIAGTTPAGAGSVAEPIGKVATVIADGAMLELNSAYSGTITFAGDTGTLKINDSTSFSGTIAGHLAIGNVIDLADITAGANATISYSGNNSPGTLTVSDGTHTANIALQGNYSLANFTAYSDGHGGTSIIDPPTYVGTGLDANGWTTFTPSSDTRIIYVSSSSGRDSNSGLSQNAAVATIDKGLSLIRDGSADWLLLKAGDTWVNQEIGYIDFSGRSASEPILISSYGTGARPLIETGPNGSGAAIGSFNTGHSNIALVGLDFYAYTRDPSNPNFAGPGPDQFGMRFVSQLNNFLVEDTKFSFYNDSTIEGGGGNIALRRNIIENNYDDSSHSQGLYVDHITNLVLEQNLFNHNGWNSSVPGAEATIFNHNLYLQYNNGLPIVTGNIFVDASATGAQFRTGGTITDNLFISNPVGFQIGSSPSTQPPPLPASTATVSGNVVLAGDDINGAARGWGIVLYADTGLVQVQNNIISHEASSGNNLQSIFIDQGANNDIVTNNIIYSWGGPGAIYNRGSGNTISNAIDQTGYLDPNRSIETYMSSIGGSATLAAFVAAAENQSKSNWNPQFTADVVNNYIEAGFAKTAGGLVGSLSINDVTISEGDSGTKVATFTATRSGGTAAFDVNYATSNGTATVADGDYVAASNTLHFGANQNTQTISVTVNGDTNVEANETFSVALSNATNGATISDGQGVGTITNDDGAAITGSVSINDVTISEGDSGTKVATFTATRSGGTAAFDVNYATSNGTATVADGDYVAASNTLHFGANQNTQTISVTVNGDTNVEANETFSVALSNATNGATISDGQGVGTITNDDSAATSNLVVNGGFESGNFSGWTLSGNSSGNQIYIAPTVFPGEVHTGSYSAGLGSMNRTDGILTQNIATMAGQHYTLSFWIESDNNGSTPINHFAAEWNGQTLMAVTDAPNSGYQLHTFDVVGINGNSVLEFDGYNHPDAWRLDDVTLTAVGVAPPAVAGSISINDVTISEGDSGTKVATFTATRSGGTAAFDVNFATSNGTATVADSDYVAASNTLHFGANQNTQTMSVTVNGDTKVEGNETFNVGLSNATNGAIISDSQGVGTITNDDGASDVTLIGTSGQDTLRGGAGDDTLNGEGGGDWLYGNDGDDTLIGGSANDQLFGGAGADVFMFTAASNSPPGYGQRDLIWDFQAGIDKIDLSAIDASMGESNNQSFKFMGEGTFDSDAAQPGLVKFHYDSAANRTLVEGTVDSSAGIDFQISLIGQHVLTAADFML